MKNFDDFLRQGVAEYTEEKLQSPLYREDKFEFSPEFEKKMDKMLKSEHNVYHKLTLTRARKVLLVAAIIAAMLAASLSVEAVRNTIANFFVQVFSDHDTISANTEETTYPTKIEKAYEFTDLPEGCELSNNVVTDDFIIKSYSKGKITFEFSQHVKDSFLTNDDNEHSTKSTETYNGQEYYVSVMEVEEPYPDMTTIIWDNGEYVFMLTSNLPKDRLIKICDSLAETELNG